LRRIDQKVVIFCELLEKTTTSDEYKCLKRARARYTNANLDLEVKKSV
jgi:hypothetical protein